MNRYINDNLTKARWHKVSCSFDAFEFDNKFNRIIKFVCKQLLPLAKQSANRQKLREILFILDDVADEPATADDCSRIAFNPMFEDFATVRDYCYLFLKNSISLSHNNKLQLFAFLLPMEYVFEDFIYGFIDQEIESIKVNAQNMSKSLDKSELFKLRPDLMLQYGDKRIIADTKCKIIYNNDSDPKNGLSQSDLYQMVAYAIRFELTDIVLFYPDTVGKYVKDIFELTIPDDLAGKEINIKAFQVPIINKEVIEGNDSPGATLGELFTVTKQALITRINEVLLID
jgi:5-methylcytosine-specific restriction enzyme subunit McrC